MARAYFATDYIVPVADQTNGYAIVDLFSGIATLENIAMLYPNNVVSFDLVLRRVNENALYGGIPIFVGMTAATNKSWVSWSGKEKIPESWLLSLVVYPVYTADHIQTRVGINH